MLAAVCVVLQPGGFFCLRAVGVLMVMLPQGLGLGLGQLGALTTYLLHLELLSEMPSPAIIYFLSSPTAYHVALG